jgi:DNA invertase Pin-like site-specific DNA recombinase
MTSTKIDTAIYLRISLDPTGDGLAIARQREDCQRIAAERGWHIVEEYADTVSAADKRKRRPSYDRMVADYQAGRFGAIVCWDLDRLTRQPRQLEDWIDAAEDRGLLLVTANGEADLSTDGGRLFARVKAAVARGESERKAARQRRAALQRAEHGRPPLGVRLTGYAPDATVAGHEAAVVREMFDRFHAGDSLRGIVAWLTETGVPARGGRPWNPSAVRSILVNPRYAGRAVYQGKANGHTGRWEPLVEDWLFDAVADRLADPRRRSQVGTDRRHLGSGLYLCGVCGQPVVSHSTRAKGKPSVTRYRCAGHVVRSAVPVDAFVLAVLRERLGRPDLAGLLTVPKSPKAKAAAAEIRALRGRLAKTEADYDADLIDGRRYRVKTEKIRAEIAAAEAARARLLAGSNVAATLLAPDPVAAFDAAPLGIQRAVLEFFMTVRLLPARRGHHFDRETVVIEPRQN